MKCIHTLGELLKELASALYAGGGAVEKIQFGLSCGNCEIGKENTLCFVKLC